MRAVAGFCLLFSCSQRATKSAVVSRHDFEVLRASFPFRSEVCEFRDALEFFLLNSLVPIKMQFHLNCKPESVLITVFIKITYN